MGYACPVCESAQPDGEHLANHLAITALLHGDAHERWLAEHAPDWADRDPAGLAEAVVPAAPETDHEPRGDETVDDRFVLNSVGEPGQDGPDRLDAVTREALEEARTLTRERRAESEE